VPCRTRVFFVLGCIIAVVAGFVDGSMLVPYKVYQLRSIDASNMQDQTFAAQEAVNSTTDISEVLEPVRKSIAVPIKRIRKGVHSVVGPVVNATKPLQKSIKETVKPAAHAMSLKVQHTNASYSYLQGMSAAQFAISAVLVLVLRLVEACDPEGLVEQTRQASRRGRRAPCQGFSAASSGPSATFRRSTRPSTWAWRWASRSHSAMLLLLPCMLQSCLTSYRITCRESSAQPVSRSVLLDPPFLRSTHRCEKA